MCSDIGRAISIVEQVERIFHEGQRAAQHLLARSQSRLFHHCSKNWR
jgi:hypothetical protein